MIVATRENIYGIDVFTFYDTNHTPFQLTFQESLNGKHVEVSLVNLLGGNDSRYCKYIRQAVSGYVRQYLIEKNCTIYFDIEVSNKRGHLLFVKFIRWMLLDNRIDYNLEITPINGINYIEVYIKLKESFIKNIDVS